MLRRSMMIKILLGKKNSKAHERRRVAYLLILNYGLEVFCRKFSDDTKCLNCKYTKECYDISEAIEFLTKSKEK